MNNAYQTASRLGGSALGGINSGLSIYQGATSGNPIGQSRAGLQAAKLYGKATGAGAINSGATVGLDALGMYQGIRQGGVRGYGQAAGSGLQMAGTLLSNPALSAAGGYIMAPLAVYNAINNWQSGKTGSNALNGAEAGAAIGSIVPGLGTLVGGVIGGAVGALSSAFGPGAKDAETTGVQGLIDYTGANKNSKGAALSEANPYIDLAGLMDRRESTLPMYSQYGRMGEQKFTNDMTGQINQAISSGQLAVNKDGTVTLKGSQGGQTTYDAGAAGEAIYNNILSPWVNKMGSGYDKVGDTYKATTQGLLANMAGQYVHGQAAQNWKAVGGDSPFANIYKGNPLASAQPTMTDQQVATQAQAQRAATGQAPTMAMNLTGPQASMQAPTWAAKGGKVNTRLRDIYKGSYAQRKVHYDDGGSVDYFTPTLYDSSSNVSDNPYMFNPDESQFYNPSEGDNNQQIADAAGDAGNIVNAQNDPYAYGQGDSSGAGGGLAALLKGFGVGNSTMSSLAPYAALLPLLQSVLGGNKGAQQPGLPSQFSGPVLNMQTPPAYSHQQQPVNMTMDQWLHSAEGPEVNFYGNNSTPITPMSPPNMQVGAGVGSSPYTGSQVNPYSVVQANGAQAMPMDPNNPAMRPMMKAAGGIAHFEAGGRAGSPDYGPYEPLDPYPPYRPNPPTPPVINPQRRPPPTKYGLGGPTSVDSTGSRLGGLGHVKGPGDGTSDSIRLQNAYLSNGEYVIDAPTVSAAGNGSNDAGAKVFDRIRADIRKHSGKAMVKGKQPMTAKQVNIAQYMGGAR